MSDDRNMPRLTRRNLLARLGSGAAVLAAAAAATTGAALTTAEAAAGSAAQQSTPAAGTRTLTFWGHEDHPMDAAVAGFQQTHPDVNMDWQHLGDWLTKFKATLASGQGVPDL